MSWRRTALITAALAMALTACGGDDGDGANGDGATTAPEAQEVTVTATDLAFDPTSISVTAGSPVTVTLENEGAIDHDFVIDGFDFDLLTQPGESNDDTETFEAGTYTFYCSIPGHREAGMEGTLTAE